MALYPRPTRNIDLEAPDQHEVDIIAATSLDGIVVGGPRALVAVDTVLRCSQRWECT